MCDSEKKKRIYFPNNVQKTVKISSFGYDHYHTFENRKLLRMQDGYTVHFVVNGKGHLFIRGSEYEINHENLFFIPPYTPFSFYPDEKYPWRHFYFYMYGDMAAAIGKTLGFSKGKPIISAKYPELILKEFEILKDTKLSLEEAYNAAISVINTIILSQNITELPVENQTNDLVSRIQSIIDLNYTNSDFSINDIPPLLYISESHMRKVFKERLGMAPISYLVDIRLKHAASLIYHSHTTNMTVNELCEASGFGDVRYFMKRFKEKYNMTVKEYKNDCKKQNALFMKTI